MLFPNSLFDFAQKLAAGITADLKILFLGFESTVSASTLVLMALTIAVILPLGQGSLIGVGSPKSFLQKVFPSQVYLSKAFVQDVKIVSLNIFAYNLLALCFFSFNPGAWTNLVTSQTRSLLSLPHINSPGPSAGIAINLAYSLFLYVCLDGGKYAYHVLAHRLPILWSFHKVHHSQTILSPLTANREHLVDAILFTIVSYTPVGAFVAIAPLILPVEPSVVTLLGIPALSLLGRATHTLGHSHVWWSWGRLELVFLSPAMHILHHQVDPQFHNKNFGFHLSIFDGIFGTIIPTTRHPPSIKLGVIDEFDWNSASAVKTFTRPFEEIAAAIGRRWRSR